MIASLSSPSTWGVESAVAVASSRFTALSETEQLFKPSLNMSAGENLTLERQKTFKKDYLRNQQSTFLTFQQLQFYTYLVIKTNYFILSYIINRQRYIKNVLLID